MSASVLSLKLSENWERWEHVKSIKSIISYNREKYLYFTYMYAILVTTLTVHFIRYTLLVKTWTSFCFQNYLNRSTPSFNKVLETFMATVPGCQCHHVRKRHMDGPSDLWGSFGIALPQCWRSMCPSTMNCNLESGWMRTGAEENRSWGGGKQCRLQVSRWREGELMWAMSVGQPLYCSLWWTSGKSWQTPDTVEAASGLKAAASPPLPLS